MKTENMQVQRHKGAKAHSPSTEEGNRKNSSCLMPHASRLVGLYIHIPFCAARCHYCDFFTFAGIEHLIDDFVLALCNELESISSEHNVAIKTIFFGGGTPSILQPSHFEKVFSALHKNFTLIPDAEITVECNPGTLSPDKVKCLKSCGINRISLGVQSFNDEELKFLGRIHTSKEVIENFNLLRRENFSNISMDFIFGFPGHTLDDWNDTLSRAVALQPDHISAYNFILEEETKFYGLHENNKLKLLDEEDESELYEYTMDKLTSYGYNHYEISNFSKPSRECKHNLIYWQNKDYLGAGPSAWSYINGVRWENTRDLRRHIETWKSEVRSQEQEEGKKTEHQLINEISDTLIMGLRLTKGISLSEFQENFGKPLGELHGDTIEKFTRLGLLETKNNFLRLTRKGLFLSNEVLCEIV